MSENTLFLLHALSMGVVITFVYDWLLVLRKVFPHGPFLISLEDLGFWIFCAVYVFLWMYRESNGTLRWFAVAGALTGMLLYKKTLSRWFILGASRILQLLIKGVSRILCILFLPMRFTGRKLTAARTKIRSRRKKILDNLKIRLKSYGKALKMKLSKR